jgi:O-antigen/teichoic acid export membrane protein
MSLIGPFTVVLIPQIAESFYRKDFSALKTDIEKALNFTIFMTALAVPAFTCFGEEVGIMLFDSYEGGVYTSRSSILMMLICTSSLTTSVLNSIGQENKTFLTFTLSNIFMLIAIWFLPKYLGIYALLVGYICVYGVDTLLNLRLIRKKTGVKLKVGGFAFYAVIFTVPTCILGFLLKNILLPTLGMFLTTFIGSVVTVGFNCLFFVVFGLIDYRDICKRIPFIKKRFVKA